MRVLVMFDLPVNTAESRREYSKFRKFLIKSGFLMLQESVYCKLVPNAMTGDFLVDSIDRNKPKNGLVQILRITEKQFNKMECIVGEFKTDVLTTDERLVVL